MVGVPSKLTYVPRDKEPPNSGLDAATREKWANAPPVFRAEDKQGREWFETPIRLSLKPGCGTEWLWPGRIPLGELTVIEGSPGAGKSFLALDLAARVSRGAPFPQSLSLDPQAPGSAGPAKVLLVTMQDNIDTVSRRLSDLGADPKNIYWEGYVREMDESRKAVGMREMQFPVDLEIIEGELHGHPDIR